MKPGGSTDTRLAHIYFTDRHVDHFRNQVFAYALWLALPKGVRVAFRGADNQRPVLPWGYADRP